MTSPRPHLRPAPAAGRRVVSLEQLGEIVVDGATVALGGTWLSSRPMAAVRQLVRSGRRDLRIVSLTGGLEIDILVGAGVAREVVFCFVSLGPFGLAPRFEEAVAAGAVVANEHSGHGLTVAIEAASRGLDFMPFFGPVGTSLADRYPTMVPPGRGTAVQFAGREASTSRSSTPRPRPPTAACSSPRRWASTSSPPALPRAWRHHRASGRAPPGQRQPVPVARQRRRDRARAVGRTSAGPRAGLRDGLARPALLRRGSRDGWGIRALAPRRPGGRRSGADSGARRRSAGPPAPDGVGRRGVVVSDLSAHERIVICLAQELRDGDTAMLGTFTPIAYAAVLLAQRTHAPRLDFNAYGFSGSRLGWLGFLGVEAGRTRQATDRSRSSSSWAPCGSAASSRSNPSVPPRWTAPAR